MWQRMGLGLMVLLAACGTTTGATEVAAQSDAGTDAVVGDAAADAVSDVALTDTVTDISECSGFMVDCKTSAECCAPYSCLNITGTPKCQTEGPEPDIAVSDVPGPDVLPDAVQPDVVQPDAALTCKDGSDDVIPAASCSGGGATFFPTFSKLCASDSDCFAAVHQINCCGTHVAWGLNACEAGPFATSEAQCVSQYPGCGCAAYQTMAEDGFSSFDNAQFSAKCVAGTCRSFVKDAKVDCTSQGLQQPKPVKGCTDASDCDFSMLTVDCCGSMQFTGIAKFAKTAYDVEQQKCAAGMAICDCMAKPTTLDDGSTLTTSAVPVACVSGTCMTGTF